MLNDSLKHTKVSRPHRCNHSSMRGAAKFSYFIRLNPCWERARCTVCFVWAGCCVIVSPNGAIAQTASLKTNHDRLQLLEFPVAGACSGAMTENDLLARLDRAPLLTPHFAIRAE